MRILAVVLVLVITLSVVTSRNTEKKCKKLAKKMRKCIAAGWETKIEGCVIQPNNLSEKQTKKCKKVEKIIKKFDCPFECAAVNPQPQPQPQPRPQPVEHVVAVSVPEMATEAFNPDWECNQGGGALFWWTLHPQYTCVGEQLPHIHNLESPRGPLGQAQASCNAMGPLCTCIRCTSEECNLFSATGIKQEKGGRAYTKCGPRPQPEPQPQPEPMEHVLAVSEVDNDWQEYKDSFLFSYASWTKYDDLDAAKEACLANYKCNGITQEPQNGNKYSLRKGPELQEGKSPTGETSWVPRETERTDYKR